MSAQCHANADLARATSDGIGFHAIYTHDREEQCDSAKDAEENPAKAHKPKAEILLHLITERRDTECWQIGINAPEHLAQRRDLPNTCPSISRGESDMKKDVAPVALRKRHE